MSRRLINRAGAGPASSTTTTAAATSLPPYEPPSCPLNDAARRALGDLANTRTTLVYHSQLKESMRVLGASVGDLQERLREQQNRLAAHRARREERGSHKSADEERLETHVAQLEAKVHALTDRSELAVRDIIDRGIELEDETGILGDLYTHAQTEHIANVDPDDPEDSKVPPPPSTLHLFRDQRKAKDSEYTSIAPYERYALNNDYAAFKKLWHDAMAGEDGPPLPDAMRWFRADGRPIMRADEGLDDGSDDEIAVAREVLSLNCPLTLRQMVEPYSNRKCKHTFEKVAILDYLPMRGEKQCPQTGCSQLFSRPQFDHDFFLDQAMVRRIKRARQAQEHQEFMDDDDEDDGDEDVMVRGQKTRPGAKGLKVEKKERR